MLRIFQFAKNASKKKNCERQREQDRIPQGLELQLL
jgi:hypothetical protein